VKGIAMRKFMVLPLAGMLAFSVAGPVAAGANVSNSSGSGQSISGEWYSDGTYGSVSVVADSEYGTYGDFYQESGEWIECDPGAPPVDGKTGAVPYDTTGGDETYGFVGTRTYGYAYDIQVELSRRLETGRATGTVELYTETFDECNGIYGGDGASEIASFDINVTAAGPLATFRGSGHYKVPSQYNEHQNTKGSERQASGSIVAGSSIDTSFDSAYLTKVSWSAHSNH
jgi:hypothetical protein